MRRTAKLGYQWYNSTPNPAGFINITCKLQSNPDIKEVLTAV